MREGELEQSYHSIELLRQELRIKDTEIGKLYAVVNDQSVEIGELTCRLEKLRQDNEYESYKTSKEIEHWKKQLTLLDKAKQEEMQHKLGELDAYHQEQAEKLKHQHANEVGALEEEASNLKSMVGIKNEEIESLISQNVKQKEHAEVTETALQQ